MLALSIEGLKKSYDGKVAVDNISFSVEKGDFFGFLGPNGAGKTTTIHCITGIAGFTQGTIKVFGIDVVKDYRRSRAMIGLSPQDFNMDFFGTIYSSLDYVAGYYGLRKAERKH